MPTDGAAASSREVIELVKELAMKVDCLLVKDEVGSRQKRPGHMRTLTAELHRQRREAEDAGGHRRSSSDGFWYGS